jgi:hypothetical protein
VGGEGGWVEAGVACMAYKDSSLDVHIVCMGQVCLSLRQVAGLSIIVCCIAYSFWHSHSNALE